MRDPRRGLQYNADEDEAESKKKGGFGVGKALLVIVLMLLLGAGGAFGYWKLSTPKVPANQAAPSNSGGSPAASPSASPTGSPAASPTGTPKALGMPGQQVALVVGDAV
jgi:hypothetical protein